MKNKISAWALYEKEFKALSFDGIDKSLMIFPTKKLAKETRRGLWDGPKGVSIIRVTIKWSVPK